MPVSGSQLLSAVRVYDPPSVPITSNGVWSKPSQFSAPPESSQLSINERMTMLPPPPGGIWKIEAKTVPVLAPAKNRRRLNVRSVAVG